MWRNSGKKSLSLFLVSCMVFGTLHLTGCSTPEKKKEVVTLDAYSMVANYSGVQTGWMADILKEKFGVKLNITPDGNRVYENRKAKGSLGDIVIFGSNNDQYADAVRAGLLYDWNKGDLLTKEGSYIKEHMADALKKNQDMTSTITQGKKDTLYGFGFDVATSKNNHASFIYTWDLRWDVYKELGYPEVKNLEDYEKLMADMCKQCPENDDGERTYAASIWPDWDDAMLMYVKASATTYYGYDELGIGLFDPDTGTYYDALQKDGPYLEMLRFYHHLYRDGLLDPESISQDYNAATKKVKNGTIMFSIFNYAGSAIYNQSKHISEGKAMLSMRPQEATPLAYGMSPAGADRTWTIGASTKYPELCMEFINWLCTPEGRLTMEYGPKDLCWKYDKDKNTRLTKLGMECRKTGSTNLENGYKGTFDDGTLKLANTTWSIDAENPESNGETYNYINWKSTASESASAIEKDWQDKTGYANPELYMSAGAHKLMPSSDYVMGEKSAELKAIWKKVTTELKDSSWKAIFATSEEDYEKIVDDMIKACGEKGYDACVEWSKEEAAKKYALIKE